MRYVLTVMILGLLGTGLGGCSTSSSSGTDSCFVNQGIYCERTFACNGGADPENRWASPAECTKAQQELYCSNVSGLNKCSYPLIYNAANDNACTVALGKQTCTDFLATIYPPICQQICVMPPS